MLLLKFSVWNILLYFLIKRRGLGTITFLDVCNSVKDKRKDEKQKRDVILIAFED